MNFKQNDSKFAQIWRKVKEIFPKTRLKKLKIRRQICVKIVDWQFAKFGATLLENHGQKIAQIFQNSRSFKQIFVNF